MMSTLVGGGGSQLEIVVGLTGFVIIHVFIAPFPPAQGECNQMVNTKFTRPVNEMPMSTAHAAKNIDGNSSPLKNKEELKTR